MVNLLYTVSSLVFCLSLCWSFYMETNQMNYSTMQQHKHANRQVVFCVLTTGYMRVHALGKVELKQKSGASTDMHSQTHTYCT